MHRCRSLLVLLALVVCSSSSSAGIFRKTKSPNPAERVNELLNSLRSEPDERKRLGAAEELRQFDARLYPNILPALIESLANDPSPSVRAEAAASLGKIRPIEAAVGQALEKALAHDGSMRVRMSARTALVQYHLYGYRSGPLPNPVIQQTGEPPLAVASPTNTSHSPTQTTNSKLTAGRVYSVQTVEPPLAAPLRPVSATAPLVEPLATRNLAGSSLVIHPLSRNFTARPLESTQDLMLPPASRQSGFTPPLPR